jgi:predicted translin family RNA/ssDNA-binding protein
MEELFDTIAQEAISKARKVDCSVEEYIDGLKQIIGEIEMEIEAALSMGEK